MKVVLLSDVFYTEKDSAIKAEVAKRMQEKGVSSNTIYAHVSPSIDGRFIGVSAYDRASRKGCKFFIRGSQVIEPEEFYRS